MFALVLLCDLFFNVLPEWEFVFSADGVLMASELNRAVIWSLFTYTDNAYFHAALLMIYGVSLFGLLIGFRARQCALVASVLMMALLDKNLDAHSNAERLAGLLLLWSAFLPTTRYWSFEAALNPDNSGAKNDQDCRRGPWPIIPLIAIKFQIIVIYLHAGLFKLDSNVWISGRAMGDLSKDQVFATSRMEWLMNHLNFDTQYALAWSVIIFQLVFSLMIYAPVYRNLFRALAILGAAATHLGFLIFLQIHMFPFICFCYLVILMPDSWFDRALKKRREKLSKIRIYFDPDCGFCRATALLFREFCLGPTASVEPSSVNKAAHKLLQKHNSWIVYGHKGEVYMKWPAVSYVMKQSPVFWIFGVLTDISLMKKPMECVYTWIGNNRSKLSEISHPVLKPYPNVYPERIAQYICLFCLVISFTYTTWALPQMPKPVPLALVKTAEYYYLDQRWNLFVGDWINSDSYVINADAKGANGETIDLQPYLDDLFVHKKDGRFKFYGHRTMRFVLNTVPYENPRHREGFARYLCHKAQEDGYSPVTLRLELRKTSNINLYKPYFVIDTFKCDEILKIKEHPKTMF